MGRKPKIDRESIKIAYEMAAKGISNKQIMEALNISHTAFYRNVELVDTVKKAKSELRQSVSKALLQAATNGDTTSLIFLAKRLNLFSENVEIKLGTPKQALKSFEQLANADTSIEHRNSLRSIISDYLKAYEITELEDRISKLEDKTNG